MHSAPHDLSIGTGGLIAVGQQIAAFPERGLSHGKHLVLQLAVALVWNPVELALDDNNNARQAAVHFLDKFSEVHQVMLARKHFSCRLYRAV